MRPAWPPWPNIGNRPPARWPLGSAGADAAQPWLGQPSLRAEEQVDGVRRKSRDPHPSLPQGDWGPLLSLPGWGEVASHPVPLSHREACRARTGDSVSCRRSCRSSGAASRVEGAISPAGVPQEGLAPNPGTPPVGVACSTRRHAWGSSRARHWAGSEGVLPAGGPAGSPLPAPHRPLALCT